MAADHCLPSVWNGSWNNAAIPFGSLHGVNRYEPLGDGQVRVSKVFQVRGPFAPIFRLIWEKGVRADMRLTFTALQTEARRREQVRA